VNRSSDDKNKVPRTRRGRGHRDVASRAEEDPRLARRAPSVTRPAGDGSVADAVWAGVRPEDIGLDLLAAESAQRRAEAAELDQLDGEPSAEEATADQMSAEAAELDQLDGEPSAEDTNAAQSSAEAGEVDQVDGEPPAQDATSDQPRAEAGDVDQSEGEPSAEETVSSQTGTSRHGPQDPADKRKVSKNALRDGFFAQQFHTIVGDDPLAIAVFEEYLESARDTYHPVAPADKLRVYRLALLYYKRDEILECAETAERTRSVLRHRRAVRFAPVVSIAELLEKDRAALLRRSDGVGYVIAVLEDTLQAVQTATTSAAAVEAVELFEQWFGAVLQPCEEKLAPGMPGLARPDLPAATTEELMRWLRCRRLVLETEESTLRDEEAKLAAAEETRRRVPHGKHFETIARAAREVNREIRRLEWDLAPLRGSRPSYPRGR
jgi:hypothetical protein